MEHLPIRSEGSATPTAEAAADQRPGGSQRAQAEIDNSGAGCRMRTASYVHAEASMPLLVKAAGESARR